jgi:hypothetical protein
VKRKIGCGNVYLHNGSLYCICVKEKEEGKVQKVLSQLAF